MALEYKYLIILVGKISMFESFITGTYSNRSIQTTKYNDTPQIFSPTALNIDMNYSAAKAVQKSSHFTQ